MPQPIRGIGIRVRHERKDTVLPDKGCRYVPGARIILKLAIWLERPRCPTSGVIGILFAKKIVRLPATHLPTLRIPEAGSAIKGFIEDRHEC